MMNIDVLKKMQPLGESADQQAEPKLERPAVTMKNRMGMRASLGRAIQHPFGWIILVWLIMALLLVKEMVE